MKRKTNKSPTVILTAEEESHRVWNKHNPDNKIERGNYKDVIHHKDKNHDNNDIKNLQKMTHGKHTTLHSTGRKHTEEAKRKSGLSMKGKNHSEKTKQKMRTAKKKHWEEGIYDKDETRKKFSTIGFTGRKHSKETKKRMRIAWGRRKKDAKKKIA